MRSLSAGLLSALSSTPRTACWLARFVLSDGTIKRVSSINQNITIDVGNGSETFLKDTSFKGATLKFRGNGDVPDGEVTAPIALAGAYTAEDVFNGIFDQMTVTLYVINYANTANQGMQLGPYTAGETLYDDRGKIASWEVRGILQRAKEITVEELAPACRSNLFDDRPGFCNLPFDASWVKPATVATVAGNGDFTITVTEPRAVDGWFELGTVKWLTGNNAAEGYRYYDVRVWTQATSRVQLWGTARKTIQVGDTLEISPGCDKRFATCRDKFDNSINFRGEHQLPGPDFVNGSAT